MKERTKHILAALIHDFIEHATPVASRRLIESGKFSVSSATVRNEFAVLEEVGLIRSPHVSAGKVPTSKGYRFFVNELLEESDRYATLEETVRKQMAAYKLEHAKESVFDALRLIARVSGNVAFAHVEADRTLYIGLSHVLRSPEFADDPRQAARIVEVLEGRDTFQQLLSEIALVPGEIRAFIGEENLLEGLESCAMMVTRFENSATKGLVGILGPMRMRYGLNKVLLQNVGEMVG